MNKESLLTLSACMICIGAQAIGATLFVALGIAMILAGWQAMQKTHATLDTDSLHA